MPQQSEEAKASFGLLRCEDEEQTSSNYQINRENRIPSGLIFFSLFFSFSFLPPPPPRVKQV
jgi:hypothetical protein